MINVTWYSFRFKPEDTMESVTCKLVRRNVNLLDAPHAVYVIRFASNFLIEYADSKLSPVVYIGQGRLRLRLDSHRKKWLRDLQNLLPQALVEVKVCFPRADNGTPLHKEYEAHLLAHFKKQFGQLPLRNRKRETRDGGIQFSKSGRQQALGHGTGKKYAWSIKPLPKKIHFTKYEIQ